MKSQGISLLQKYQEMALMDGASETSQMFFCEKHLEGQESKGPTEARLVRKFSRAIFHCGCSIHFQRSSCFPAPETLLLLCP